MRRAFITSAVAGTLLLAGAATANADGLRFDVRIGAPLYGERSYLPPPPPRYVVHPRWHDRHIRYWMPMRPDHYRYEYRHFRHNEWRGAGRQNWW